LIQLKNPLNYAEFWNQFFQERKQSNRDLDWGLGWLKPHLEYLRENNISKIVDIGCGTGSDAIRLAQFGFEVVGIDVSEVALGWARKKANRNRVDVSFQQMDISKGLLFPDRSFDCAISHLVLHSFSDGVTRLVFADIHRILKPSGFLAFEVNSIEDMQYRQRKRIKQLEEFYFLEEHGQSMHFFNEEYIRSLLQNWRICLLKHKTLTAYQKHTKCVWHCLAKKRAE
jgi:ubiquinone/menaquinone biosynthesis C-methylase UbiE